MRAPSALAALALVGCSVASDVGEDIGNAVGCAIVNCTESSTLNVDEISPRFTATQTDGNRSLVVEGSLGKSANLLTTVLIAPNERLTTRVDGGNEVAMDDTDGKRQQFSAQLAVASAQPLVRVVFTRAGVRHVNEVTLPAAFAVLQPTTRPTPAPAPPAVAAARTAAAST